MIFRGAWLFILHMTMVYSSNLRCICDSTIINATPECLNVDECMGDSSVTVCITTRFFLGSSINFASHCTNKILNSRWLEVCSSTSSRCCSTDLCNKVFHNNNTLFNLPNPLATEPTFNTTKSVNILNATTPVPRLEVSSAVEPTADQQQGSPVFPTKEGIGGTFHGATTTHPGGLPLPVILTVVVCAIFLLLLLIIFLGLAAHVYCCYILPSTRLAAKEHKKDQVSHHSSVVSTCPTKFIAGSNPSSYTHKAVTAHSDSTVL